LLGFTAFFSIVSCCIGYFLSKEGGYAQETLDLHFYSGLLTALLVTLLFLMSCKSNFKSNKVFFTTFILSLIAISVAGHFGSVLTHGTSFLTEHAFTQKEERNINRVDSLKIYQDVVVKILDSKCVQCHNSSKLKGGLSLIDQTSILKGGDNGPLVVSGNAKESNLIKRIYLPISNKEHMPPEGKTQLNKDEIWLLNYWINNGLNFDKPASDIAQNDSLRNKLAKYLVIKVDEIPKASISNIEKVKALGFRVFEIVPGKAALNVKYLKSEISEGSIRKLNLLNEQIVELDFGTVALGNAMTSVLKNFSNLKTLRINSTKITDEALDNFQGLKKLEVLNLNTCNISNSGLEELLEHIQPKKIYTWQSKVENNYAERLERKYDVSIVNQITDAFVGNSKLKAPTIHPSNTLFKDSIQLTIKSNFKDVLIRYTFDEEAVSASSDILSGNALVLKEAKTLNIAAFKKGWEKSAVLSRAYAKVKHEIKNYTMLEEPDPRYAVANKLFDLQEGSSSFKDGHWTGYFGKDLETIIDLGATKKIDNISMNCLEDVGSWILYPTQLTVYSASSKNGIFKEIGTVSVTRKGEGGEAEIKKIQLRDLNTSARYFKIVIKNFTTLPKWHPNAGSPSWLFVDEIYFW